MTRSPLTAIGVAVLAASLPAQTTKPTSEIPLFFMAGDFDAALRESKARNRPMLIKGVGQIVDPLAAKNIDKGEC